MRTAYTDGAASSNPGPSGWAYTLDGELESGRFPCATNNQMEMYAILQAVMNCQYQDVVKIHTDSKLSIGWLSKGFRCRKDHIREIRDLCWDIASMKHLTVQFEHVKGHAGNPDNLRVDRAAHAQAKVAKNAITASSRG
jgi:ribonuclease HI